MYRKLITLLSLLFFIGLGASHNSFAFPAGDGSGDPSVQKTIAKLYFSRLNTEMTGEDGLSDTSDHANKKDSPEPVVEPITYQVLPGDTLFRIANEFNLRLDVLMAANDIQNPKALQVGQRLQIPNLVHTPSQISGSNQTIDKVLSATLTAYTAGYESTGKKPSDPQYGVTASGNKVQEGRTVAVDPSVIPIGSTVYIEGIGVRKAEDTGRAIRGKKIDVYISDLDEAREFGVKHDVKVYVLRNAA